jgi:L-threonylcarbamoyladenylate synthase
MSGSNLREQIERATRHLTTGHCVAMPTETVYGLAARVDSDAGIRRIFELKERPSFDPLIVHIDDFTQVPELARTWPAVAESLARKFWPGPLTLVVPKQRSLNPMITSGLDTVGIRMPNHTMARALIRAAGRPLAAPSANRFGRTSPTTADHVRTEFREAVASGEIQILDGGPSNIGVESTVCMVDEKSVTILRPGGITKEEIQTHLRASAELAQIDVKDAPNHQASPGHTEHHYETSKPLIVSWSLPLAECGSEFVVQGREIKKSFIHELVLPAEPSLAARVLYSAMREGDQHSASQALFIHRDLRKKNPTGLWCAIDDRIMRAARLQLGERPN